MSSGQSATAERSAWSPSSATWGSYPSSVRYSLLRARVSGSSSTTRTRFATITVILTELVPGGATPPGARSPARQLGPFQGLIEVGDDVERVLDPDRDPDGPVGDPQPDALGRVDP